MWVNYRYQAPIVWFTLRVRFGETMTSFPPEIYLCPFNQILLLGMGHCSDGSTAGSRVLFTFQEVSTSLSQCRNFQDLGVAVAASPCQERRCRSSGYKYRGAFTLDGLSLNLGLYPLGLCDLKEDIQHSPASVHPWSRNKNTLLDYHKG